MQSFIGGVGLVLVGLLCATSAQAQTRGPSDEIRATAPHVAMRADDRQAFFQVLRELDRPVRAEFFEAPLSEVLPHLQDSVTCALLVDEAALARDGIDRASLLITLSPRTDRLRHVLDDALTPHGLAWAPTPRGVLITTRDAAEVSSERLIVVVYPVADLIDAAREPEFAWDGLIDAITDTVRPESWKAWGSGEASIAPSPDGASLVVAQHWRVHEELNSLLDGLRTVHARQGPRTSTVVQRDTSEPDFDYRYDLFRPAARRTRVRWASSAE